MMIIEIPVTRTIDARASFSLHVRAELLAAIADAQIGDVIAVWSRDALARIEVPAWVELSGHRVVGIESREDYDEIFVEKRH